MFTDIVGYTRLMGQDERKALKILENNRSHHKELLILHNGKLLKEIGDGMLCSFESASDAVKCSIELIRKSNEYEDLKLRIGIHVGEVVFSRRDVFGDGVNIASRIESLAIPDSVLVSDKVYEEVKNKSDIRIKLVGTCLLKNDSREREIYAIANKGLQVPESKNSLEIAGDKPELLRVSTSAPLKQQELNARRKSWSSARIGLTLLFSLMAVAFGSFLFVSLKNNQKVQWARQEALPKIERLLDQGENREAFKLALEAEKYILNDSMLHRLWPRMSGKVNLNTDPQGAMVFTKSITGDNSEFTLVGQTPLVQHRLYDDYSIYKIEKPGYKTREFLSSVYELRNITIKLLRSDSIQDNEVFAPFMGWHYRPFGTLALMKFHERPELKDFMIDKYELTNREYKVFVDSGGYRNKQYWEYPFKRFGKTMPWEKAMELFVDQTGQPGPATWEVGDYPDGEGAYPVAGVSWYEAMAYAKFSGKQLTTAYHWMYAATPLISDYISQNSNFSKSGTAPVGSYKGIGVFGTYDMAGNVREWCQNIQSETGNALILGGGWKDESYAYNIIYGQDPFDRSDINGFRCMRYLDEPDDIEVINGSIPTNFRDYTKEKPVNDDVFEIFLRQFNYDKTALNEKIEIIDSKNEEISLERITVDAAYGNERLSMYLFVPKKGTPPFQTVIHFPSTALFTQTNLNRMPEGFGFGDLFSKNGRAFVLPIYKGALERNDNNFGAWFGDMGSTVYKDMMIMWVKDIGRCIDYLETRSDIDPEKIAYTGTSLGAANGAIIPAVETRIKTVVLTVAGLWHMNILPEVDQINYLPRIKVPVLMINGKYDHIFPLESSQIPMFELLGTPPDQKKRYVYEAGHHVPQNILIRETLNWLDTYLGPVEPAM